MTDVELTCRVCGRDVWTDVDGTAHHWGQGMDLIDHGADADHVPVPEWTG